MKKVLAGETGSLCGSANLIRGLENKNIGQKEVRPSGSVVVPQPPPPDCCRVCDWRAAEPVPLQLLQADPPLPLGPQKPRRLAALRTKHICRRKHDCD